MPDALTMKELLEAGVHFGHQTRRWNPKMKPFIFGARNGIHILDLSQTVDRLLEAVAFAQETVASGREILFVGTKKQAQDIVHPEPEARNLSRRGGGLHEVTGASPDPVLVVDVGVVA